MMYRYADCTHVNKHCPSAQRCTIRSNKNTQKVTPYNIKFYLARFCLRNDYYELLLLKESRQQRFYFFLGTIKHKCYNKE